MQRFNSEKHVETTWAVHVVQDEVGRQTWMEQESQHRIIKFLNWSLRTPPEDLISVESDCEYAVSKTSRKCTANTLQRQFHGDYSQSLLAERTASACRHPRAKNTKKQFGKKFGENFVDKEFNAVFFFLPPPFFRRRSQVDDCFTGQSPGNAVSIPAAPDVHEWLGEIQASAP